MLALLFAAFSFVPSKVSRKRRAMIGLLHLAAHMTAALILMLLMELAIETCIRHKLLATSGDLCSSLLYLRIDFVSLVNVWLFFYLGYHTLYEWYRLVESQHFPDPKGLRERMEQWTFGLYPACIKYLMSAFDVPEVYFP